MDKKTVKVLKMLLQSIKGTTNAMEGHRVQHENIENTISAIREIIEKEEDKDV